MKKGYQVSFYVKRFGRVEPYMCALLADSTDGARSRLSELWNFAPKFRALAKADGTQCHLFGVKIRRYPVIDKLCALDIRCQLVKDADAMGVCAFWADA